MRLEALKQGSEAWQARRRVSITGTDAAVINGTSKWCSLAQLYRRKKQLEPDQEVNAAMMRGRELEPQALQWYQAETGNFMTPAVAFHDELPYLMASLDGLSLDEKEFVEIKCPGQKAHDMAKAGELPPYYYDQMQHYLMTTGLDSAHYCSFDGRAGVIVDVKHDKAYTKNLLAKEQEFYARLMEGIPPEDERGCITTQATSEQLIEMRRVIELRGYARELEILEEKVKDYGDDGDMEFLDEIGMPIMRLQRVNKAGTIDYKKLCQAKGITNEDLEAYRKAPTSYYKLTAV